MANYTAAEVKKLRELTGSGMMACKKALEESEGNFDKAVEILRIKGAKDVGKRAERTAAEGLIAVSGNTMVEINSETDFVAKNSEFIEISNRIAEAAAAAKANSPETLAEVDVDGKSADTVIKELSAKIGEKLELRRAVTIEGDKVAVYLHHRSSDLPPAVGVLVAYTGDDEGAAKAAAMQVAALKATYLSSDDVPEETVAKEREIAEATAREEGKPEKALPNIIEGRLKGYFKDACLLEQPSVTESKKTVKQVMDEAGVTLTGFVRFEVGQG